MENADSFFQDMQKQCLADGQEHASTMHEALIRLEKSPKEAVAALMNTAHNLKGNFQAVGFLPCSAFLHRFESVLVGVQEAMVRQEPKVDDLRALEFFLSDVISQIQSYFTELATVSDSEELGKKRDFVFTIFKTWNQTEGSTAPAAPMPSSTNPDPAVRATEATGVPEANTMPVTKASSDSVPRQETEAALPTNGLFLRCRNESFHFALRIEKVVEIVHFAEVNPLPCPQKGLLGLMNLRGDVIPMLQLSDIDQGDKRKQLAVICKNSVGKFGVPVEAADSVVEFDLARFQSAEASLGASVSSLVTSLYMEGETPIFILEIDRALAA